MSSTAAETIVIGRPRRKDVVYPPSTVQPLGDVPRTGIAATSAVVPKTIEAGIYFTAGAILHITVWNSVLNQSLTFQCWYLNPQGQLKEVASSGSGSLSDMSPGNTRTASKQLVTMPATGGTVVSFTVRSTTTNTARGQTLVKASLDNTSNGSDSVSTTLVLVYGYVYTRKDLCYPGPDAIQDPISGNGWFNALSATMTAGTDVTQSNPTNTRWKVTGVQYTLVTSAAAANRTATFSFIDSSGSTQYTTLVTPAMTAAATWKIFLVPGYISQLEAAFDSNKNLRGYMPPGFVLTAGSGGGNFTSSTALLDVGDVWTAVIFAEEFLEPKT